MTTLALDVQVRRGDFVVEVAAEVPAGSVLALIGPNGAGKTTVLRAVAGLTEIERGRIALGGTVWDDPGAGLFVPAQQRRAPLVFQDYRLFPHLSVLENVAFAPRAAGRRARAARAAATELLGQLGLADLAGRKPSQLSGGQAQRVAVARALAADPQVLLLDEPLAALDARTRVAVRGMLQRTLRERLSAPCLLVTHDPLEAMVLADTLAVIEDGRVVQLGSPAVVARRPATEYVARLVGLNLYSGVPGEVAGQVRLDGGGVLNVGGAAGAQDWAAGTGSLLVAVSPSSITVHPQPPDRSSARNVLPGTIAGLELLTDRVRVEVAGTPGALVDITAAAFADLELTVGQQVWLTVKASEVTCYPG